MFHWISSCPQCNSRKRKQVETAAGGSESRLQAPSPPQTHEDTDRWVGQGAGQTGSVRREAVIEEVEVSLQLQKIE